MFQNIKTQLVELSVVANSTLTRFQFPTQNFLRTKEIVSLETYSANDLSFAPSGNVLITGANLKAAYLTLYGNDPENVDAQGEWIQRFPLISLHNSINGTDPYVFDLAKWVPRVIVWEKSFIEVFSAGLANAVPISFLFNVGYMGLGGDS